MASDNSSFQEIENTVSSLLIWLFCCSDSEINIKSSWGSLTSQNSHNGRKFVDPFYDETINNISKKRQLEQALGKLSNSQNEILFGNFCSTTHFPLSIVNIFSKETKINLSATILAQIHTKKEYNSLISLCEKKMLQKATIEEKILLIEMTKVAQLNYINSIMAFFLVLPNKLKIEGKKYK